MSIFKEKTLEQQVNDFKSTVEARRAKITGKINTLDLEAKQLLSQIEADTAKMVDLELADDNTAADKLRKTSRTARIRLEEIEGEIEGYRAQFKNNRPLTKDDIDKLRVVAQKEMKNNSNQSDLLYDKIPALESQKEEIEKKIKAIKVEAGNITNNSIEGSVHDALLILDDRYGQVNHLERERFVKRYLGGDDLETLFKIYGPREESTPKPDKGVSISYGEGHIHSLADVEGNFTANAPKIELAHEPKSGPSITYGAGHVHSRR